MQEWLVTTSSLHSGTIYTTFREARAAFEYYSRWPEEQAKIWMPVSMNIAAEETRKEYVGPNSSI